MLRHECREKVLAKLTAARNEIEDAVKLSTPAARYDAVLVSEKARGKLSAMIDDLNALIRQLESSQ